MLPAILMLYCLIFANYQVSMNWAYISNLLDLIGLMCTKLWATLGKNQSAVIKSWNITVHLVSDKPDNNFMTGGFHEINDSLSNGALLKLQRQSYIWSVVVLSSLLDNFIIAVDFFFFLMTDFIKCSYIEFLVGNQLAYIFNSFIFNYRLNIFKFIFVNLACTLY